MCILVYVCPDQIVIKGCRPFIFDFFTLRASPIHPFAALSRVRGITLYSFTHECLANGRIELVKYLESGVMVQGG